MTPLPIVPSNLKQPPHYRTSTGADPVKTDSRRYMATNVPAGQRELRQIASSVNATMWPKKRLRDSCAALYSIDIKTPYRPRQNVTHDNPVKASATLPRMPMVMSRQSVSYLREVRLIDRVKQTDSI